MAEAATKPAPEAKAPKPPRNPVPETPNQVSPADTVTEEASAPAPFPEPKSLGLNRQAEPFKIKQSWCRDPGQRWLQHEIQVPFDTKFEDLLRPEAWALLSAQFMGDALTGIKEGIGSTLLVKTEDMAWEAKFTILFAAKERMEVVCNGPCFDENGDGQPFYFQKEEIESDRYNVSWDPGNRGYNIVRKSDNAIVAQAKDVRTRHMAAAWLRSDGR